MQCKRAKCLLFYFFMTRKKMPYESRRQLQMNVTVYILYTRYKFAGILRTSEGPRKETAYYPHIFCVIFPLQLLTNIKYNNGPSKEHSQVLIRHIGVVIIKGNPCYLSRNNKRESCAGRFRRTQFVLNFLVLVVTNHFSELLNGLLHALWTLLFIGLAFICSNL